MLISQRDLINYTPKVIIKFFKNKGFSVDNATKAVELVYKIRNSNKQGNIKNINSYIKNLFNKIRKENDFFVHETSVIDEGVKLEMEQKYGIGHMFQIIQRSERTQHLVKVVSLEKMLNWKQLQKFKTMYLYLTGLQLKMEFLLDPVPHSQI